MNPIPVRGHNHTTPPKPKRGGAPEITRAVRQYSACTVLDELSKPQLQTALRLVNSHPEAQSAGYSLAKTARRNLENELNKRA